MRGSAVFRTGIAPGGALAGPWVRNSLWRSARAVPSLDLRFAENKSLVDAVTGAQLVTHTRASSATFVDSSGVLRSAVTNLVLRSEEFDTTWTRTAVLAFGSGSITNAIAAPNGTVTADKIVEDTTSSSHNVSQVYTASIAVVPHTASFYVKAAERTAVSIWFRGNTSANRYEVGFNLATGTVRGSGLQGNFTSGSASIQSVGDGWFRCIATATPGASETEMRLNVYLNNSPTLSISNPSYTGDGTSGIYLWGAQLEQASTVGDYVPTTSTINSAPRFDHNPTTGESLGLLVEEARTNSIRNNTMVGAAAGTPGTLPTNWQIGGGGQGTLSRTISLGESAGISYIDFRFFGTTSTAGFILAFEPTTQIAALTGQNWTSSFYIALTGGSTTNISSIRHDIVERTSAGGSVTQNFSADLKSSLTASLTRSTYSVALSGGATTAFAQPSIELSFASGVAIDITIRIGLPQLEQGAFATSVIPTTSATATRAADVAQIAGSNFGVTRTNLLLRSEEFDNASWVKAAGSSVSPNQIASPNGTITADQITGDGTQTGFIEQLISIVNGTTYTYSVYLKKRTSSTCVSLFYGAQFNSGGANCVATWNFDTGVSSFTGAVTGSMTAVGNGWFRCLMVVTATTTNASTSQQFLRLTSNSGDVYVWGAQLETGSAATPYIPSTTTFTSRASGASYFDAAGVLQWKPQNLLVRSEEFNDATWTKVNTTVTANSIAAPNGTITADTITDSNDGAATAHSTTTANQSLTSGLTYTISVYAKAGTLVGTAFVFPSAAFTSNLTARFNISTGTIAGLDSGLTGSITAVGDGWYRCSVTATATATASGGFQIRTATASASFYQGNGTGTIYLWGAQLEQNAGSFTVPGEYTPTVATATGGARNSAFLPDSSGVFRSAGPLLLEEARTNIISNSENFGGAPWSLGEITVTADAAVSPTGATTADSLLETTANMEHTVYVTSPQTFTTATHSLYVKPNGRTNVALRFYYGTDDWVSTVFSLTGNGSVTQSSAGSSSGFSAVSSSIANVGNGWYRISMTGTQTSRGTYGAVLNLCTSSTPTLGTSNGSEVYAGDITKGVYVWGAQLEAASTASSYIPTTGSTVTRAADVSTSTATSVFESSWYNQTEGTVYHQGRTPTAANFFSIDDGTVNNRITSYMTSATAPFFFVQTGGGVTANLTSSAITAGSTFAQANVYKAANFAMSTNGGTVSTSSSGAVPVVNKMVIGANVGGTAAVNGTIKRLTFWPTRLANATLQQITQ